MFFYKSISRMLSRAQGLMWEEPNMNASCRHSDHIEPKLQAHATMWQNSIGMCYRTRGLIDSDDAYGNNACQFLIIAKIPSKFITTRGKHSSNCAHLLER